MPTNSRKSKCQGRHFSNISFLESISEGGKLQKKQVKPAKSGILFITKKATDLLYKNSKK